MKSLSGLDATFLYLETPETPMHVGSFHLYELPRSFRGSFHKAVQEHIGRRMHLSPIFSRKLAFMPLDLGHPMWVEAGEVDLDFHIRKVAGGKLTVRKAEAMAAKLHSRLVDRGHPLWEFHIFDDIAPPKDLAVEGRLVGFYSKIHHAALDGKGGTMLANAILDLGPQPREVPPPDPGKRRRTAPDVKIGEMIGAVFSNTLAQYAKIARSLPGAASSVGSAVARRMRGNDDAGTPGKSKLPMQLAPKTIFNVGIGSERSFATARLPLAECRAMAKAVGGSFNDMVLWLCSTALRHYLAEHGGIPKKSLVAAMPVSLRDDSNKEMNNQASMSLVQLGTHIPHPLKRMKAIMESTGKVKAALSQLKSVLPTDYPSLLAPWLVGRAGKMVLKTYGRVTERLPAVSNLAISNVPGPQVPLYLAGARMITFHPLSIIMHGMALNITIQTYAGHVDFGLVAGREAVPQLQSLADALELAFKEAQAIAAAATAAATPPVPQPPARTPRAKAAKSVASVASKNPAGPAAGKRVAKVTRKPGPLSKRAESPRAPARKAATV